MLFCVHKLSYLSMIKIGLILSVASGVSEIPIRESKEVAQGSEVGSKNTSPSNAIVITSSTSQSSSIATPFQQECKDTVNRSLSKCPSGVNCSDLGGDCLDCTFNCTCVYGQSVQVECQARSGIICMGEKPFKKEIICRYCYQTNHWEQECLGAEGCRPVSSPRETYISNCTVHSEVVCLGNRVFPKKLPCNWTSGYKWSTALLLSITLGGFGADRFYLGHWQEGIGKLFSFGGLGVWTILDVILIAIRYLGPADGSLYI